MVNFEWSPFLVQPGHLYIGKMLKGGRGWRGVAGREGGGVEDTTVSTVT